MRAVAPPHPTPVSSLDWADSSGDVITLLDRDCSVQLRHQKVIEMAPALTVSDATRASLARAAVTIAKVAGCRCMEVTPFPGKIEVIA